MDRSKCVRNGIDIDKRTFFIITGANMAGKSTYLRTVGVNYLLACIGAPVWANEWEYPARLVTSLRTSDSLTDNESYFFAELKRLKLIIDKLKMPKNSSSSWTKLRRVQTLWINKKVLLHSSSNL